MNIGYVKFTMNMEVDFSVGKIGHVEARTTLFKSIIDAGWNLTLYSQVTKENEKTMLNKTFDNPFGINNKWIDSIDYQPTSLVKPNTDLLIVENGPDNLMFKTRYGGQPFIRRCAEVMDSYKGLVFIINGHPDVPFPLEKMAYCKVGYDDKNNVYRQGKGSDVDHSWASYNEICKDKKLVFFDYAYDLEKYYDYYDRKRQGYRKHNVLHAHFPIVYGKWLVQKKFRKNLNKSPGKDFTYIGYPRDREKEYERFIMPITKEYSVYGYGPWHKKKNLQFKEYAESKGIIINGFLKSQALCQDVYHDSFLSLNLMHKRFQECGVIVHRILETINSGCIILGIRGTVGIENYLDNKFLVSTSKEIRSWIGKLKNMKYSKRRDIWEQQYDKIRKYNGRYILKHLMKIYRKEKL